MSFVVPFSLIVRRPWLLCGLVVLAFALAGCAPRSAEEVANDRARILGTWEYRTSGIGALQHGTLQIVVQDAQLVARLQDSWRGTVRARVDLQGSRMELTLDRLRLLGRLEHGRFVAAAYRPMWDVSRTAVADRDAEGRFVARRVGGMSVAERGADVGCPSLLHEASFACSPIQP